MGYAVIYFGEACLVNAFAYVVGMQLLFTSGPYFDVVVGAEAIGGATWALLAAYRMSSIFRLDKANRTSRQTAALGFWIGVLASIGGLAIYTSAALSQIDV